MGFLIFLVLLLNLIAIYRVANDEVVLFDSQKPKYIILTIVLPIIGAIITIKKTSSSLKLGNKDLQDTPQLTKYNDAMSFDCSDCRETLD